MRGAANRGQVRRRRRSNPKKWGAGWVWACGRSEGGDRAITLFFLPHPRWQSFVRGEGMGLRRGFRGVFSVMRVAWGMGRSGVQDAVFSGFAWPVASAFLGPG